MKRLFRTIPIILLAVFASGCTGSTTHGNTDTAGSPATTDTMPVVHPQNMDSSSIIKTPPVNDSNVVKPDSAVKSK
jgi:hypothetical protein